MACKPWAATTPAMRYLACLALFCVPLFASAQLPASADLAAQLRAGNLAAAQSLADSSGDRLTIKLVTFFRLLARGEGTADEINRFIALNPDWPEQGLLALRAREAAGLNQPAPPPEKPDFLTQAEALHAQGQDADAAKLWLAQGKAAMASADLSQQTMFWTDQNALARDLLQMNDAKAAYDVVTAITPPASAHEQVADQQFLAGFIALRFLHEPKEAVSWFTQLANGSTAVITQGRAWYWLGRSQSGQEATDDYTRAAQYADTYYGQLSALALGDTPEQLAARVVALGEPQITPMDVLNFALMELPRAAAQLAQMNDMHDAAIFLNQLGHIAADDRTRELGAKLALGLNIPQSAVAISRVAGADGQMLVREGWPMPVKPPMGTLEPAIAYAIMRQESSFDPGAISSSGAIGLMQLLRSTAALTARKNNLGPMDVYDPNQNMQLGTIYLAGLIKDFGNCLPLAIAAYNGGPTNVAKWLRSNGDPELGNQPGGADIIDWVEEIPFGETRNYVQRVSESIVIYQALLGGAASDPLSPWLRK